MTERILVLDFGSQVTQLIARRLRETGVYAEILPFDTEMKADHSDFAPKGIILSGGPMSVVDEGSPRAPMAVFDMGVPIFGICYGQQTMCQQLGGKVISGDTREFGRADLNIAASSPLFDGLWDQDTQHQVWMSHGDKVDHLPDGFDVIATSSGAPFAAIADESRRFYGVQFHPEVVHTPDGKALLERFAKDICGCRGDWTMASYREQAIAAIREKGW
jgi:GMP synthase (glutamine-hydrolysing)